MTGRAGRKLAWLAMAAGDPAAQELAERSRSLADELGDNPQGPLAAPVT